ncbi:MAG: hypothetical protein AAF957_16310 [Planctomycetota bacterium]
MIRPRPTLLLLGLAVALAGASCKKPKVPDNPRLYSRAAQSDGPQRNPVILIPGILGSTLIELETDRIVWGGFVYGAADPQTAEGARLVALPYLNEDGSPTFEDTVVPDGALDRVRVQLIGIPVSLEAYHGILQSLGVGGYTDRDLEPEVGGIDYGSDHFTCYQFGYDWRRSNAENAVLLRRYVDEVRETVAERRRELGEEDPDVKVDIVAHSMGGLVTRYMLRYGEQGLPEDGSDPVLDWSGVEGINTVILCGTPSGGSVLAIRQLLEGQDYGFPFLPDYSKEILGSFPSIYELLPRDRHGPLVMEDESDPPSLVDAATWDRFGWGLANPSMSELAKLMPDATDEERRGAARRTLDRHLDTARRFQAALDVPSERPYSVRLHLILGDAQDTPRRLSVRPDDGRAKVADIVPGDMVVPRSSALMDEREDVEGVEWGPRLVSPVDWTSVVLLPDEHLALTRSPIFTDNLLYLLLEAQR